MSSFAPKLPYAVRYVTETSTTVCLDCCFSVRADALDRANEINRGAPKHKPAVGSVYFAWVDVLGGLDVDAMTADQLNAWYAETVGYRPQDDSPTMSDAELRELVRSYLAAAGE